MSAREAMDYDVVIVGEGLRAVRRDPAQAGNPDLTVCCWKRAARSGRISSRARWSIRARSMN
jgi:hypothetical protein